MCSILCGDLLLHILAFDDCDTIINLEWVGWSGVTMLSVCRASRWLVQRNMSAFAGGRQTVLELVNNNKQGARKLPRWMLPHVSVSVAALRCACRTDDVELARRVLPGLSSLDVVHEVPGMPPRIFAAAVPFVGDDTVVDVDRLVYGDAVSGNVDNLLPWVEEPLAAAVAKMRAGTFGGTVQPNSPLWHLVVVLDDVHLVATYLNPEFNFYSLATFGRLNTRWYLLGRFPELFRSDNIDRRELFPIFSSMPVEFLMEMLRAEVPFTRVSVHEFAEAAAVNPDSRVFPWVLAMLSKELKRSHLARVVGGVVHGLLDSGASHKRTLAALKASEDILSTASKAAIVRRILDSNCPLKKAIAVLKKCPKSIRVAG